MASNHSAVLDVVSESKEITSLLKQTKENDLSLSNNSILDNTSSMKHLDTLETYITFRITTKVARIEFTDNEYVVRRRYNDFLWLRQKLVDCHPFCIIPPLPGKHSLVGQLDRYSKDFILLRMKALNVFISRLVKHPILSCNEHLKLFLIASQTDFNLHRRQRSNSEKTKSSSSLTNYTSLKYRHIEFDKMKAYLTTLTDKLIAIEKISHRINKEKQDLVSELQYFYPIFITWASTEKELGSILQCTASAIEKTANVQNNIILSYSNTIGNPIKEFVAYVEVVQETLQKRETYQSAYESSMEELSKKKTEKNKLLVSQDSNQPTGFSLWKQPSCDDKLEKLGKIVFNRGDISISPDLFVGLVIPQLVKKTELHQDNLECANEQLRSDLEQWHIEKQQCLKKILLDFVNKQIELYEKGVAAWENVTNKLTVQIPTK
ncbi:sorting nexin-4 [Holotrichia oblita]|uniref:Sorting nexin-4 n=1 Tax=Holotrichia oblita TaxID=644536 RepID=A0ACB9T0Z1_HOLOL|nr:sorting nexin-4 [Holotrichia oblita]